MVENFRLNHIDLNPNEALRRDVGDGLTLLINDAINTMVVICDPTVVLGGRRILILFAIFYE